MEAKKAAAAIAHAGKPTDPVFRLLVEHAESVRTEHGLIALRRLGKELDADLMQISLHKNGNLHISISVKDRHYTIWYWADGQAEIKSYRDTLDATGKKTWTDIDRYDTKSGVTMANGITWEGGE